jgi:hypothetical protein
MSNDELSLQIVNFLQAATNAADQLSLEAVHPLEYVHIQDALVDLLKLEDAVALLSLNLTEERIVSSLKSYNFDRLFPETVEDVLFDSPITPSGTRRHLAEVTVRSRGEVWRIHKNDADPWPSNPHAHNLDTGQKLHLGTGELFLKRKMVGKITQKSLLSIRSKVTKCKLPPL